MALKKVKGNFERMFDKNLTDLVRGIRNNKDNEVSYPGAVVGFPLFLFFAQTVLFIDSINLNTRVNY